VANKYLKYQIVKKVTAIILLFLLAFSVTPIKVIHDIVAKHHDSKAVFSETGAYKPQLSRPEFNCLLDNLVVESPFTNSGILFQERFLALYSIVSVPLDYSFISSDHPVFGLRGPPMDCPL
jgi:hypothetical protein